jgi:hypothetical protein
VKDMSNSAWAAVFIFLACVMALVALYSHSANAPSVITIGSSIITGAFGYIQGKQDKQSSLPDPPPPGSTATSDTHVQVVTPPASPK